MICYEGAMNATHISKQFRGEAEPFAQVPNGTSRDLAKWIAENSARLDHSDLDVLFSVGRALYAAEAEQKWRDSW